MARAKSFILDTSVLLHDPNALFAFEEHTVILPLEVVVKLDRKEREPEAGILAANARTVIRMLDRMRKRGSLTEGVDLPNGGTLRMIGSDLTGADTVLQVAQQLKSLAHAGQQIVVVTKDIGTRLKCDALGVAVEDYKRQRVGEQLFVGYRECVLDNDQWVAVKRSKDSRKGDGTVALAGIEFSPPLCPNEFVAFRRPPEAEAAALAAAASGTGLGASPTPAREAPRSPNEAKRERGATSPGPSFDAKDAPRKPSGGSEPKIDTAVKKEREKVSSPTKPFLTFDEGSDDPATPRFRPIPVSPQLTGPRGGFLECVVARAMAPDLTLHSVKTSARRAWNIDARSPQQEMALELLCDPTVPLVTLVGKAGTGKTLVALAAALQTTLIDQAYTRILVTRPIVPLGKDIGYMPGSKNSKLSHWMQPIFDNLQFMVSKAQDEFGLPPEDDLQAFLSSDDETAKKAKGKRRALRKKVRKGRKSPGGTEEWVQASTDLRQPPPAEPKEREMTDSEDVIRNTTLEYLVKSVVQMEAVSFIRGRTIADQFLMVDECQNLTPHEVKTIISRAGEGTKIVLTGDPEQIDNPFLDATSNGLSYCIERMKDSPLHGHVTFVSTERSSIAALAAERL